MKRTEKEEIKKDGAKAVKNSGRGMRKGDAMKNAFLIDYKHCGKSHTVSLVNWKKHAKDAWNEHYKHPLLCLVGFWPRRVCPSIFSPQHFTQKTTVLGSRPSLQCCFGCDCWTLCRILCLAGYLSGWGVSAGSGLALRVSFLWGR